MATDSVMSFPVVVFIRESLPCLIKDTRQFAIWPVATFQEGLIGTMIVDSEGSQFLICGATKKGYPKPLFGFSLLCKRSMLVEIEVNRVNKVMSAHELTILLREQTAKVWEALDEGIDVKEMEDVFVGCQSIADVMRAYAVYLGLEKRRGA